LSKYVNTRIDAASDAMTMYGVALLRPLALLPIITGKRGRIHGASTVSTPAPKDKARNDNVRVSTNLDLG